MDPLQVVQRNTTKGGVNPLQLKAMKELVNDMDEQDCSGWANTTVPQHHESLSQEVSHLDEFPTGEFGDFCESEIKLGDHGLSPAESLYRLIAGLPLDADANSTEDDGDETRRQSERNGFSWEHTRKVSCIGWDDEAALVDSLGDMSESAAEALDLRGKYPEKGHAFRDQLEKNGFCFSNVRSVSFNEAEEEVALSRKAAAPLLPPRRHSVEDRPRFARRETPQEANARRRRMEERRKEQACTRNLTSAEARARKREIEETILKQRQRSLLSQIIVSQGAMCA